MIYTVFMVGFTVFLCGVNWLSMFAFTVIRLYD